MGEREVMAAYHLLIKMVMVNNLDNSNLRSSLAKSSRVQMKTTEPLQVVTNLGRIRLVSIRDRFLVKNSWGCDSE